MLVAEKFDNRATKVSRVSASVPMAQTATGTLAVIQYFRMDPQVGTSLRI